MYNTHTVEASQPSKSRYEECRLLGCDAVWLLQEFLRSVLQFLVTANVVPN
jgi:hypothetical protein